MTALPMTGFHRTRGFPRMENNTLELQLLSESCRALAISNVQTADPATDSFRVRDLHPIPLFSEQVCVSDLPREAGQSFHLDEATSVLRVAHVPQKPWYVILGTIAVGFGGSAFALRLGFT